MVLRPPNQGRPDDALPPGATERPCALTEFVDSCVALFFSFDAAKLYPTMYYPTDVLLRFEEARNRAAEAGLYTQNEPVCFVCGDPATKTRGGFSYCNLHDERVSLIATILRNKPDSDSLALANLSTEELRARAGGPTQDQTSEQDKFVQHFLDGLLTLDELAGLLNLSIHDTRHLVSPRVFEHALQEASHLAQLPVTLKHSC